jgi:hypothetical protein
MQNGIKMCLYLKTIKFFITFLLVILTFTTAWAAEKPKAEEPGTLEEIGELGEGRRWIPALSFPPSDPDSIEGEVFFGDRELFCNSRCNIQYKTYRTN